MIRESLFVSVVIVATASPTLAQTAGPDPVRRDAKAVADMLVERTTIRAASQPGSDSVVPLTETVLLGVKEGAAATARVGVLTKWGDRDWLAVDTRLTNKLPDSGLPALSGLDGLSDGAEVSLGFGFVHRPPSAVTGDGSDLIKACDSYYAVHANRQPAGYQAGQCAIDAENEDDDDLMRAIAPHVDSRWGYSLQARVAWSRPDFKFRPEVDAKTETVGRSQRAVKVSASVLTPSNVRTQGPRDLVASWFLTFEAGFGNDWDLSKAQSLCRAIDGAVSLNCENVAVGAPFEQDVKTASISGRRYFTESIAIAPAWTRRWAKRVDGLPATDGGKWRFDLPVYFLWTEDKKGLSGGVAVSWAQGQGHQYSVFVGALLPAFEFR